MSQGSILVASEKGHYLLRLLGDIRVTLCVPLAQYSEKIFNGDHVHSVAIDMRLSKYLDSTTLGLLTRLALEVKKKTGVTTIIICSNADILRLLQSMGIDKVFNIVSTDSDWVGLLTKQCQQLHQKNASEDEIRHQVIAAHKTLVSLSSDNKEQFSDLITMLEEG